MSMEKPEILDEEMQAIQIELRLDHLPVQELTTFDSVISTYFTYFAELFDLSVEADTYYAYMGSELVLTAYRLADDETISLTKEDFTQWVEKLIRQLLSEYPEGDMSAGGDPMDWIKKTFTPTQSDASEVQAETSEKKSWLPGTKLPSYAEVMRQVKQTKPASGRDDMQKLLKEQILDDETGKNEKKTPVDPVQMRVEMKALVERTNTLRDSLMECVFGQDDAVNTFVEGYFQAELRSAADPDDRRPRAAFLFAGPPGVGKTYLAEKSAELLGLPFLRMDMSEYADHNAKVEFTGSDSVYKDSKPGNVTAFAESNPKCIILFDEVEKAHSSVTHLFLQMLDAGVLRDSFTNKEVSFRDAILIFTTNAGKHLYENSVSANLSGFSRKAVLNALRKDINPETHAPYFPAAICSRFAGGNVVMFNHMESVYLLEIIRKEFSRQQKMISDAYGISLSVEDPVLTALLLAESGTVDARTIFGRSAAFLQKELYELFMLLCSEQTPYSLEQVEQIRVNAILEDCDSEVRALFEPEERSKVLLFSQHRAQCLNADDASVELLRCRTVQEAEQMLKKQEIAFAVIDWNVDDRLNHKYLHIEDMDSPARDFFHYLKLQRPDLPVYVLEDSHSPLRYEERVGLTEDGARGILTAAPDAETLELGALALRLHRDAKVVKLASANRIVAFETAQSMSDDGKIAYISLFDFRIRRSVDAEDSDQMLSDISRPEQRFADVIGAEDAKAELQYFVDYLKNPAKLMQMGVRQPKGVLLYGPPGTGKTLLAKAMAGESDVTFIHADGTQFLKHYVGDGPDSVRALFAKARKYAPTILFIDEIDSIATERSGHSGSEHRAEILNALLNEMDGFCNYKGKPVFVLAATNAEMESTGENRSIDAALARRFDRKIYVERPGKPERTQYLHRMNDGDNPLNLSVSQIDNIAIRSTGMSLADLENIIELSYRNAVRMGNTVVNDAVFEDAFESFRNGKEKAWSAETRERVARHEAGHALLCWHSGEMPSYLTIVARGSHGGYMQHGDTEDKAIYTADEYCGRIRVALGGRAAEMVYYGEDGYSSGAAGDLEHATIYAERMLCTYGMDPTFGLAVLSPEQLAGEQGVLVRERINALLDRELQRAQAIIRQENARFESLVAALLEQDHLSGAALEEILGPVPAQKKQYAETSAEA